MTKSCRVCIALAVLLCCGVTAATDDSAAPGPGSVLLVGNSLTYFNNGMVGKLRRMLRNDDNPENDDTHIRSLTVSGARLGDHVGGLTQLVAETDWDVVVLQGHTRAPIRDDGREAFQASARELAAIARAGGADVAFYMTYALEGRPEMTDQLAAAYETAAAATGGSVLPVGLAFAAANEKGAQLFARDGRHPSPAGSYLATCVIYATLYGKSPVGNPYTDNLDPDVAALLQSVAWQTVSDYRQRIAN